MNSLRRPPVLSARSLVCLPSIRDDSGIFRGLRYEPSNRRYHRGGVFLRGGAVYYGYGPWAHRGGYHAAQYLPALCAGALSYDRSLES